MINNKLFGIRRNLNYVGVNFKIMFKTLIEYKASLYSALLEGTFFFLIYLYFFVIFADNFADVISWEIVDFILFLLLIDSLHVIEGIVFWNKNLVSSITNGNLNIFLTKPLNPLLSYQMNNLNSGALLYLIINVVFFPIFILFFGIDLQNVFFAILVFLLIILQSFLLIMFIHSLSFFNFGLSGSLNSFQDAVSFEVSKNFPFQYFDKAFFKIFLLLYSGFFITSLIIPLLRGYDIWRIDLQLTIMFSLIIVFAIGIWINWHYGLKRYEAYVLCRIIPTHIL